MPSEPPPKAEAPEVPKRVRISRIEVDAVLRYLPIASTDKLIEALGFPLLRVQEREIISAELDVRLARFNGDQPDPMVG